MPFSQGFFFKGLQYIMTLICYLIEYVIILVGQQNLTEFFLGQILSTLPRLTEWFQGFRLHYCTFIISFVCLSFFSWFLGGFFAASKVVDFISYILAATWADSFQLVFLIVTSSFNRKLASAQPKFDYCLSEIEVIYV